MWNYTKNIVKEHCEIINCHLCWCTALENIVHQYYCGNNTACSLSGQNNLLQSNDGHKGTEKYKEIDKEIRYMCKQRKEAWWNEKCKEIEELERKHKTKEMHAKVKEMSTKKRSKSGTNCIYATTMGKCYSIQMIMLSTDGLNMSLNCIMTREMTHQMSVARTAVLLWSQKLKM